MSTYTYAQLQRFPWQCSHGTLRPDHLAAAYLRTLDALRELGAEGAEMGEHDRAEVAALANRADELVGTEPTEAAWLALSAVEERLDQLAPVGFYFGGHAGDSSDCGFWLTEDWLDALEERGIDPDGTPAEVARLLQELDAHGIDSEDLCDAYCGTASGWSEERAGATYAEDLAEELGAIDAELRWPHNCIDWAAAWRELVMGDGYALIPSDRAGEFHVIRSV